MRKNSLLTIAAATLMGFAGGLASQLVVPWTAVHAQTVPEELTAHRLLLVTEKGKAYGRIEMGERGGEIRLYDGAGKTIWQAPFKFGVTPTDAGVKTH